MNTIKQINERMPHLIRPLKRKVYGAVAALAAYLLCLNASKRATAAETPTFKDSALPTMGI